MADFVVSVVRRRCAVQGRFRKGLERTRRNYIRKMSSKATIVDRLLVHGYMNRQHEIRYYLNRGEDIPDHLLPGRAIMKLSAEDRETVRTLTAADFYHRVVPHGFV